MVVGLTEEQETEAFDKSTLALPGRQDELVSAVAAAARRTVVVVNAATPVLMPWADEVDAILWAGLPGQEGGHAVAAALLGDIEPAGRLVTSFPAADGASPAWGVVPTDGKLAYDEGVYVGYRGFAARRAPAPAYWFGQGLGYGEWEYGEVTLADSVVTVGLTNVSARDVARGRAGLPAARPRTTSRSAWSAGPRSRWLPARPAASRSPATHAPPAPGTTAPGVRSPTGGCSSPAGSATSGARSTCRPTTSTRSSPSWWAVRSTRRPKW